MREASGNGEWITRRSGIGRAELWKDGLESTWGRNTNEIRGSRVLQAFSLPPPPPRRPTQRGLKHAPGEGADGNRGGRGVLVPLALSPGSRASREMTWASHLVPRTPRSPGVPKQPRSNPGKPTLCALTTRSSGDTDGGCPTAGPRGA